MTNILFFSVFTVHTSHNSSAKKKPCAGYALAEIGKECLAEQTQDFGIANG